MRAELLSCWSFLLPLTVSPHMFVTTTESMFWFSSRAGPIASEIESSTWPAVSSPRSLQFAFSSTKDSMTIVVVAMKLGDSLGNYVCCKKDCEYNGNGMFIQHNIQSQRRSQNVPNLAQNLAQNLVLTRENLLEMPKGKRLVQIAHCIHLPWSRHSSTLCLLQVRSYSFDTIGNRASSCICIC